MPALTGTKGADKVYYRHTGHPGGLRERSVQEQLDRDPRRVVEKAVKGMLPHNSRGRELFRHLHVYGGPEHPHEAQVNEGTGARARKRADLSQEELGIRASLHRTEISQLERGMRIARADTLLKRPSTHTFPEAEFEALYRANVRRRKKWLSQFIAEQAVAAE